MTQPITVQAPKHRFTTAEYHRLGEVGILQENDRVELIYGEIIQMSPIGPKHSGNLDRMIRFLTILLQENAIVRCQSPIQLSTESEPEPDITILRPRADFYTESHPTAKDVLLIIELSESSLSYDREVKLPLYTEAGITEYWIVDLKKEKILVYAGAGLKEFKTYTKGEVIFSKVLLEEISVEDLLGK